MNMKKKKIHHHQRNKEQNCCCKWQKLVIGLLCVTVTLTLVVQLRYMPRYMPGSRLNYLNFNRLVAATPKIAFLYIARNRLALDFVWQRFFERADESKFSIYIHSRPGFIFSKGTTRCTYFNGRQLSNSIQVDWGEASMIQAERLLLRKALQDPANQRFVFVSDSCVPLYNFSYIYDYIMSSQKSFIDSFSDTKEGRYNPKMSGTIPVEKWRKGSQWGTLIRKHAEVVAADDTVFPAFEQHCKRKPLPEFWRQEGMTADTSKIHNCIPDEHYVQTLLAMKGFEGEINRRTVTYTLWKAPGKNRERQGWHPVTFKYADATPKLIDDIKAIDHVNYETEYRTEWCTTNGKFCPCFLFARKFSRGAAYRLSNQTMLGT